MNREKEEGSGEGGEEREDVQVRDNFIVKLLGHIACYKISS